MSKNVRLFVACLLIALGSAIAFAFWKQHEAERADLELGLSAGRVTKAVLLQAEDLRVARLTGQVVARSINRGRVFHTEQVTSAPFAVSYFVNLKRLGGRDLAWDAQSRVMTVTIPDVTIERPNVDMTKARVKIKGWWVSREAGVNLGRGAHQNLVLTSTTKAKSDEYIGRVRELARTAVGNYVRRPLDAVGIEGVRVEVRFPWERGISRERWDVSRSVEEILAGQG